MSQDLRYRVNHPDVIDELFEDEYVIVNLRNGSYYGLKDAGVIIWAQISAGATRSEIVTTLLQHYDGDPAGMDAAVQELLTRLRDETLIVSQSSPPPDAPALPPPTPLPPARVPFAPPVLEKFTDMQQVLLLDPIHEVDEAGWPARK